MYSELEKQLIVALDNMNYESKKILPKSKEYRLGKKIYKIISLLNYSNLKYIIKEQRLLKKLPKIETEGKKTEYGYYEKNGKIAIYTCITGNYDNVIEPLFRDYNCEYYIYTDNDDIKTGIWQKRKIPQKIASLQDKTLINRYIKFHPHELFQDFDYAIYIDGNILIVSNISAFVNKIGKQGIAFHKHHARQCIYDELERCKLVKKGNIEKIEKQLQKYKADGMPKQYGLLECNVIATDLKNTKAKMILESWWNEFITSEGKRDQIALPYILWKYKISVDDVGTLGTNVIENPKLRVLKHNK